MLTKDKNNAIVDLSKQISPLMLRQMLELNLADSFLEGKPKLFKDFQRDLESCWFCSKVEEKIFMHHILYSVNDSQLKRKH